MDATRFDRLSRHLSTTPTRRGVLTGLATALSLVVGAPDMVRAKGKKQKLKRNRFGCVNVGGACRGRDNGCCSGICVGKRPKKGEKDRSRCKARGVGGCPEGLMSFGCGGAVSLECSIGGGEGVCHTATGAAGFCGRGFECAACGHDRDCQRLDLFGPDAACVVCPTCVAEGGTACVGAAG